MTRPLLAFDDAGNWVWDAIVLGAGPAGAIAARQLAASGARVLLVEKKAFPRGKVCGACLNESALGVLESVGLSDLIAALGGTRLDAFQLGFRGRAMRLALPGGMALSRRTSMPPWSMPPSPRAPHFCRNLRDCLPQFRRECAG